MAKKGETMPRKAIGKSPNSHLQSETTCRHCRHFFSGSQLSRHLPPWVGILLQWDAIAWDGVPHMRLANDAGTVLAHPVMSYLVGHPQVIDVRGPGSSCHWVTAHRLGKHCGGDQDPTPCSSQGLGAILLLAGNLPMHRMGLQGIARTIIAQVHRHRWHQGVVPGLRSRIIKTIPLLRAVVAGRFEDLLAKLNYTWPGGSDHTTNCNQKNTCRMIFRFKNAQRAERSCVYRIHAEFFQHARTQIYIYIYIYVCVIYICVCDRVCVIIHLYIYMCVCVSSRIICVYKNYIKNY